MEPDHARGPAPPAAGWARAAAAAQAAALADGRLDLGLVAQPVEGVHRLVIRELGAERLVAALPTAKAPAEGEVVPLAALADDLRLFPAAQGPVLHAGILAASRGAGLAPRVVQEAPRVPTLLTLVAASLGCTLVPKGVAGRLPMPGVAFRGVADGGALPRWPIALAHLPLPATGAPARLLAAWGGQRREGGQSA